MLKIIPLMPDFGYNKAKTFMKKIFLALFIVSLLYRALYLFTGIPSVTHDEADLYYSGYVVSQTAKDQYNNHVFLTTGFLTAKPAVPIYISALGWKIAPEKTVEFARLPFVILNSFIPVFFFFILYKLTKNKLLAFLGFLVFNFSPWFSYLSISGYEGLVALFFLLLDLVILLADNMDKRIRYSAFIIVSFLAFNSYMGIRLIFPFILGLFFVIYHSYHKSGFSSSKEKLTKYYPKLVLITIGISIVFYGLAYILPNTQLLKRDASQSVIFLNSKSYEQQIQFAHFTASGPPVLVRASFNKATFLAKDFINKYLYSFNIPVLFVNGDSSIYGTNNLSGIFYLTDLIFFLIGIYALKQKGVLGIKLFMTMIVFGGLPIAFSAYSPTIIFRGIMLLIPYTILIAYGVYAVITHFKRTWLVPLFCLLAVINASYFYMLFQVSLKNASVDAWHITEKDLFDHIAPLEVTGKKITIYNPEPKPTLLLYAFYREKGNIEDVKYDLNNNKYTLGNISFSETCPKNLPKNDEIFIIKRNNCKDSKGQIFILAKDKSGNNYNLLTPNQK
jgi:hypothetical protein